MPRSNIPSRLIHRLEDVEGDVRRLAPLRSLVADVSKDIVYDALRRETSSTAADAWIEIAKSLLRQMIKDVPEILEAEGLKTALAEHLSASDLQPDEEEAKQVAAEFAQALLGGWLEILRKSVPPRNRLLLNERLLPSGSDSESRHALLEAVSAFPIEEPQVDQILQQFSRALFTERSVVELPLGIVIARETAEQSWIGKVTGARTDRYFAASSRVSWDQAET